MNIRLADIQFTDIQCRINTFDKDVTAELETTLTLSSSLERKRRE